jgi:ergothioneine biosynthesis protein EgtB
LPHKTSHYSNEENQEWLPIDAGLYAVGYKGNEFCFDNELGTHQVFMGSFQISNLLVSNKDYIEFIKDDGYLRAEFWHADGWNLIQNQDLQLPLYWVIEENEYYYYTLGGLQKVAPDLPIVHLNWYEASAYASWAGARLPTEFEWEVACDKYHNPIDNKEGFYEEGMYMPSANKPNVFLGQCWQWTNSAYLPYPHFTKNDGATGEYNGKFMVNQMVLRGASCATSYTHSRPTYRNFFHPDKAWQFSGIRLARNN